MEKDFYLDQRWLASYFEKDWYDHVIGSAGSNATEFEYSEFNPALLYSSYHEDFIAFLDAALRSAKLQPIHLLEVGSSLGRNFYEACKTFPTLKNATLLEPSENLSRLFKQIFESETIDSYPYLKGNSDLSSISFDTRSIQTTCADVQYNLVNEPFEFALMDDIESDLVICSNVLDQCQNPLGLIDFLKSHTKANGVLALSCTYQWNDKYIKSANIPISNINHCFNSGWTLLGETNIEFRCRRAERYWQMFLSHICVVQKN